MRALRYGSALIGTGTKVQIKISLNPTGVYIYIRRNSPSGTAIAVVGCAGHCVDGMVGVENKNRCRCHVTLK